MKKFKITIQLLFLAVASIIIVRGVVANIHDRKATEISKDFEKKISEFEDSVDYDLYNPVRNVSTDIKDVESVGRVEVLPVYSKTGTWYDFTTYIDVRVYIKKDLSHMDPFQVRDYLEPLDDEIGDILYNYQRTDFPLIYYRSKEGLDALEKYVYNVDYISYPVKSEIYVIDVNGDEYRYAGHMAYYLNGECIEKPFLYGNSSGSSSGNSGSGHSASGGSYSTHDHAWDVDDYDDPDEYADDAWGEDFDDWDDAYDYWEDNY